VHRPAGQSIIHPQTKAAGLGGWIRLVVVAAGAILSAAGTLRYEGPVGPAAVQQLVDGALVGVAAHWIGIQVAHDDKWLACSSPAAG